MYKYDKKDIEKLCLAKSIMEEEYRNQLTIEDIAMKVNMTPGKMIAGFKQIFNKSANTYLVEARIEKAKIYLASTIYKIDAISKLIGIENPTNFTKQFTTWTGMSPNQWRKNKWRTDGPIKVGGDGRRIRSFK